MLITSETKKERTKTRNTQLKKEKKKEKKEKENKRRRTERGNIQITFALRTLVTKNIVEKL